MIREWPGSTSFISEISQPKAVFIDPLILNTLGQNQLISGFAEVVKYGIIKDKNLFIDVKNNFRSLINLENMLKDLPDLKRLNAKVIAVFFADYGLNISLINDLLCSQFSGIMLDTAKKDSGSLIDFLDIKTLKNFVRIAEKRGVLSGLAGSLKIENISTLLDLDPDVMGFRGVLCGNEGREGDICAESLSGFHKIFCDLNKSKPKSTTAIADAQLATS